MERLLTTDCRAVTRRDFPLARRKAMSHMPRVPLAALLALAAALILLPRDGTAPASVSPAAHGQDAPARLTAAATSLKSAPVTSAPKAVLPLDLLDDPRVVAALSLPHPDWQHLSTKRYHPAAASSTYKTPSGAETLANWDAKLGPGSGHLAITGTGLDSRAAALGFNAGAAYAPGPVHFDLGITGSQSGNWNALVTGRLSAGKLTFTASRSESGTLDAGLAPGQLAAGVAADSEIVAGLTLHGALNWSRSDGSADDTRSYQGGIAVSHDLGSELKLVGNASVSGSGTDTWLASPLVSGSAGLQWTPGGGPALSAAVSDQLGGSYQLSMAAARSFN
jgi:hypothetical protein